MPAKLLVVDDETTWLRVMALYLRGLHYEVVLAQSGEEAIKQIADGLPDVVIADIGMPGMDGYELCRRLRCEGKTRAIPFIFLTGRDQDMDRVKARKIGSDEYLVKPCPLERLAQCVETVLDRIEQARKVSLERIGLNGRIEDVDLLDLIQTLELNQRTGALVLSHGERTGTLYLRDGTIVQADIQSPKREEPLFLLLGWKTGRFLFIPDAAPERMPITASVANLLFQDLRTLAEHEQTVPSDPTPVEMAQPAGSKEPEGALTGTILASLERITQHLRGVQSTAEELPVIGVRLLIVGIRHSGKSELIQHLVRDLSPSRWVAVGVEETGKHYRTDVGRVRISSTTALHLIAVRAEKRFWKVWEECLPGATGAIVLIRQGSDAVDHVQAFLKARAAMAPRLPVHALLLAPMSTGDLPELPGLQPSERSLGSLTDQAFRLNAVDAVLKQWLSIH